MPSSYYDSTEYKSSVNPTIDPAAPITINGYLVKRPAYFKNKSQARGYEIALILAQKKPLWSEITLMTTSECIDVIMFDVPREIRLDIEVKEPEKSARDAMRFVPNFFEEGKVIFDKMKKRKRMWYLEIKK